MYELKADPWEGIRMEVLATVCRFLVATVFLFAGLSKLPRLADFALAVKRYGILPESMVAFVARLVPALELACGSLLLIGLGVRYVATVLTALLVVFVVAIAVNLLAGRELDCGCFGGGGPTQLTWRTIIRNLVLVAMAATTAAWWPTALSLDALAGQSHRLLSSSGAFALLISSTLAVAVALAIQESLRVRDLARAWTPGREGVE